MMLKLLRLSFVRIHLNAFLQAMTLDEQADDVLMRFRYIQSKRYFHLMAEKLVVCVRECALNVVLFRFNSFRMNSCIFPSI